MNLLLHNRLIDKQPIEELERKMLKARSRGFWTQEDIDWAVREGKRLKDELSNQPSGEASPARTGGG